MPRRDKYSITKKWEKKLEEMRLKAEFKFNVLLRNKKKQYEQWWEYEVEKNERKKQAYIKKKELEYDRKMKNEIREFEWRPKKEYKMPAPKIKPLQFALELAQENAKLRDTDENGRWRCISCDKMCEWWELAGWHRYSRKMVTLCLEKENINAQCHTCNFTTWPRWDTVAKERCNAHYDENINKKFWPKTSAKLAKLVSLYFHGKWTHYDLDYEIPRLIAENEELWKTKNFYSPKRKWREKWISFSNRMETFPKPKNTKVK